MSNKLTKDLAVKYFQVNKNLKTFSLEHEYDDSGIKIVLQKNLTAEGKKQYDFFIFLKDLLIYQNKNKTSKLKSLDEVFSKLFKLPEYKALRKKNKQNISICEEENQLNFDEYQNEFSDMIIPESQKINGDSLFDEKEEITDIEFEKYIKEAISNPKNKKKLIELKSISIYLKEIEKQIELIDKVPAKLYEIALRKRGTVSNLEKVLINKAKTVVAQCFIKNAKLNNDYLKEFDIRFFDYNIFGEKSPSPYAKGTTKVPLSKNLLRYIELEIKNPKNQFGNKGHSGWWVKNGDTGMFHYFTKSKGRIELETGWSHQDIVNFVSMKVKESIYFFRPEEQEKNSKATLDTYILSSIKNALVSLRNYSRRINKAGMIRRYKDDIVIRKLREINYLFEERRSNDPKNYKKYIFNLENIKNELIEYNQTIKDKGARINEKDIKEFMNQLSDQEMRIDDMIESDEGSERENNGVLGDVWENKMIGSLYDTKAEGDKNIMSEKFGKAYNDIFKSDQEKIALEFILENFRDLAVGASNVATKKAMKVDIDQFNKVYNKCNSGKELTQMQLDSLTDGMVKKILTNRDLFERLLGNNSKKIRENKTKEINKEIGEEDLFGEFTL